MFEYINFVSNIANDVCCWFDYQVLTVLSKFNRYKRAHTHQFLRKHGKVLLE